jgi:hypothetical protein
VRPGLPELVVEHAHERSLHVVDCKLHMSSSIQMVRDRGLRTERIRTIVGRNAAQRSEGLTSRPQRAPTFPENRGSNFG